MQDTTLTGASAFPKTLRLGWATLRAGLFWSTVFLLSGSALILACGYFETSSIAAVHWLVLGMVWVAILLLAVKGSPDPISPLWFFFTYLFVYFFVRQAFLMAFNPDAFLFELGGAAIHASDYLLIPMVVLLAFFAFFVGYHWGAALARSLMYRLPAFALQIDRKLLMLIGMMLLASALLSYAYLLVALGGLGYLVTHQAAVVRLIPEGGTLMKLAWVIFNLYFAGAVLILIAKGPTLRWWAITLLGVALAMTIGRRSPILAMLFPYLVYRHYYIKPLSIKTAMLVGIGMLWILIGVALFRVITSHQSEMGGAAVLTSAEFFVWDMNVTLLRQIGETMPFRGGMDFLPYWFRSVFDLDIQAGYASVGEALVHRFLPQFQAGIPAGIIGTLYMNWGMIGIIGGMLSSGFVARCIYEYTRINAANRLVTLLLFPAGMLYVFYYLRLGDFWLTLSSMGRIILVTILLVLLVSHFRLFRHTLKV